jgi:hypothetical protein
VSESRCPAESVAFAATLGDIAAGLTRAQARAAIGGSGGGEQRGGLADPAGHGGDAVATIGRERID